MRLLHTADWHLGHSLYRLERLYEHRQFLDWLLATLKSEQADALIIAGDIFDSSNPSIAAQELLYGFLASVHQHCPALEVVIIGGNHDSPARLEVPLPLMRAMKVHLVGALARKPDGSLDPDRLLVPLHDAAGKVAAWCAAVPFLRAVDLPPVDDPEHDPLVEGVRATYDEVLAEARRRRQPGQALLATGHCYMVGGQLSELSERKILGGNQHALPVSLIPPDVTYAALGHLHLAQRVGGQERIRYSGSPIPLSMAEADYPHQVLRVDVCGEQLAGVTPLRVPRAVDLIRVGTRAPMRPDAVAAELAARDWPSLPPDQWPYVEAAVHLDAPDPSVRQHIEAALADKPARLVKISTSYSGQGGALADALPPAPLSDLLPEEVFAMRYRQQHAGEPPAPLLAAFHELLESVQQESP